MKTHKILYILLVLLISLFILVAFSVKPVEKTVLTLAVFDTHPSYWESRINHFNRRNANIHIELVSYYNELNSTAHIEKFLLDVEAGNIPDIIYFRYVNPIYDTLAKDGIFEDLYYYLDNDPELSREDFMPKALEAMEYQNQFIYAANCFRIETFMAKSNHVNSQLGLSLGDMYIALDNLGDNSYVFAKMKPNDILYEALHYNVFWDLEELICDFDSDEFIELLQFIKTVPRASFENDKYYNEPLYIAATIENMFEEDSLLLTKVSIPYIHHIGIYKLSYETGINFVGFPNNNCFGGKLILVDIFAMTATCNDKDAAWEYIKQTNLMYVDPSLTHEAATLTLSTNRHTFYDRLELNNKWHAFAYSGIYKYRYALTEEETDCLLEMIDTSSLIRIDVGLWTIISTETELYFSGTRTAEETAAIIQRRAQEYLTNEY
ncbi:MAG: hypothetical protein FWG88_05785 [Oscillospiraceae bacterium]|nr:hypothetical protein [Oscillospiraceae bacterium]